MTVYQIAFRDSVAIAVIKQFSEYYVVDIRSIFLSDYGLTAYVDIKDDNILEEWDWAFSMVCNMNQDMYLGGEE